MAKWLGSADAEARARQVLALCSGYVLYTFQLTTTPGAGRPDPAMTEWLARSVQAIVDGADDAATAYKHPHSFTRPPVSDTFGRIIPLATVGVARLIMVYLW